MKKQLLSLLSAAAALAMITAGCGGQTPDIKTENLKRHMTYQVETIGTRPAGSDKERACADYIYEIFSEYGYQRDGFSLSRVPFHLGEPHNLNSENIIAVKKSPDSKGILAVTAHYDSMPTTPGARDNAGGISALLELSRLLSDKNLPYEIRFIALGAEEIGFWGASEYVASLTEDEKKSHLAVYNMDITISTLESGAVLVCNTLGKRSDGGYLDGTIFEPADNLVSSSITKAYKKLGYPGDGLHPPSYYGESDHVSFHKAGIDAANVCWRISKGDTLALPKEYHLPEDDLSRLDYHALAITVSCIAAAITDME